MPSFILLMQLFRQFEESVLANVSSAKGEDELVRVTRFYQIIRTLREFLEEHPEQAFVQLELLRKARLESDPEIVTRETIQQLRFGNGTDFSDTL